MQCPRCGYEGDVSKSPCAHCGLQVHLPGRLGATPSQKLSPPEVKPVQIVDATSTALVKRIPSRPLSPSMLAPDMLSLQSLLHTKPQVTDSFGMAVHIPARPSISRPLLPAPQASTPSFVPAMNYVARPVVHLLLPGTILHNGRYRLSGLWGRQEWRSGAYESTWIAQDAQRANAYVMICEIVFPETGSISIQSLLRTATMALTSIGRQASIPTLWDVFSDQGRTFFVFELFEGETLFACMQRTGRALPEQDVIDYCIQMTEMLELLAQQTPPLVHGFIQPEHIFIRRDTSQYALANFSIVLAGGGTQFVVGIERKRLSAYVAPEFIYGPMDVRFDIYALLATAYHTVTGSRPLATQEDKNIPLARRLNPNVTARFEAILARGLHSSLVQRYQHVSELRQELQALQSLLNAPSYELSPSLSYAPQVSMPGVTARGYVLLGPGLTYTLPAEPDNELPQKPVQPHPKEVVLEKPQLFPFPLVWVGASVFCLLLLFAAWVHALM